MADTPKDWEHAEDDEPTLYLDLDEYDHFLLDNPELGEELPEEEGTESKEQPECYMNLQDPEPPREALKKLALESTTPPSRDVTISDAPYETSDEACLCLLRQSDDLEMENNHLRQKLNSLLTLSRFKSSTLTLRVAKTWLIAPTEPSGCFNRLPKLSQRRTL
jgi:hypothetical protein